MTMHSRFSPPLGKGFFYFATALLLLACSQNSAVLRWDPLSPEEQKLHDRVQALQDTVWEGTTLTALTGGLLGAAVGGAQGAAHGARAGRFIGAAAGRYVAQKQAAYGDREDMLHAVTADIHAVNEKTAALISTIKVVITQQRAELSQLSGKIAGGETVAARLAARRSRIKRNVEVAKEGVETAKAQHELFSKSRSLLADDGGTRGFEPIDEEIALLTNRIASMEALVRDLATDI